MASAAAGGEAAEAKAITFPLPPPFYKLYGEGQPAPPPPAPVTEPFQLYDRPFDLNEPLVATKPNHMIHAQADGSIDYLSELRSLVPELLPLFLNLLRTLIEAPESYADPLTRVSSALAAVQHLINMVRPHQAIATLKYILELEVRDKQEQLSKLREQVQSIDQLLLTHAQQLADLEKQEQQLQQPAGPSGHAACLGQQGQEQPQAQDMQTG